MVTDGLTPQSSDMWNVEPEIKQKVNREGISKPLNYELGYSKNWKRKSPKLNIYEIF